MLKYVMLFCLFMVIVYCLGTLVFWELNQNRWDGLSRLFWWVFGICFSGIITYEQVSIDGKKK